MATQVRFKGFSSYYGTLGFQFGDGGAFNVKSLNEGVMVIEPLYCHTIDSLAKNVAGCFEKSSNFYGLKSIEFEFNGVYVSVTAKNANPDEIIQLWYEKMKKTAEGEELRRCHNKKYGYEGDGIANPAVLTVNVG